MAKHSTSKGSGKKFPKDFQTAKFQDRNLAKVNPNKEQFEPKDGEAVRQRYKMGGGC